MATHTFNIYDITSSAASIEFDGADLNFTLLGSVTMEDDDAVNGDVLDDNLAGRYAHDGSQITRLTDENRTTSNNAADRANQRVTEADPSTGFSAGNTLYSQFKFPVFDGNDNFVGWFVGLNGGKFALTFTPDPNETYTNERDTLGLSNVERARSINSGSFYYSALESGVPCFTKGVKILAEDGEKNIEDLNVSDLVQTIDNGLQEILWIGQRKLKKIDLDTHDNLLPISIKAGVLGKNIPIEDLIVSPQHRVLIDSKIAKRVFGSNEVLIAAKKLLSLPGVNIVTDCMEITYYHILCQNHEIITANGALTETLYLGKDCVKALGEGQKAEIQKLFPEVLEEGFTQELVRQTAQKQSKIDDLIFRHIKNNVQFVPAVNHSTHIHC